MALRTLARSGSASTIRTARCTTSTPTISIRSRSTTIAAGVDDAEVIGELACRLLDRALRDRPGALRLVGVSVSNLEPFRQLALA